MTVLFQEHKWIGEFFPEGQYNNRFIGELIYHPERGVILNYMYSSNVELSPVNYLHGIIDDGERCTLLGTFKPENSGFTFKNGLKTFNGKAGFNAVLFGDFICNKKLYYDVDFTLTGLQEFFFPKGYKDLIKFSDKKLIDIDTKYGRLSVGNNAKFGHFCSKDITAKVYTKSKLAQQELENSFRKVEENHPDAYFMFKKDISYSIKIESAEGLSINNVYDHIKDIANLFALLTASPVYPDKIKFIDGSDHDKRYLTLYPSIYLEKHVIDNCLEEQPNFLMPIKNSNIDLAKVLTNWLERKDDYSTLISRQQHETNKRTLHEVHSELVLYATQLEAISYEANQKQEKYLYPLKAYASNQLYSAMEEIFTKSGYKNVGEGISTLRNEIAHVGRPKRLIPKLNMRELVDITTYMQLIIISHVFTTLEIEKSTIHNFQNVYI